MRAHEFTQLDEATRLQKALAGTVAAAGLALGGKALYDKNLDTIQPAAVIQQAEQSLHPEETLRKVAMNYKIKGRELAHLMSQASHETMRFTNFEENLRYKTAERLMKVYPSFFKHKWQAAPYVNNPEKLANRVYANRYGNGDEASGDGWRYRGRGPMMITFKGNYAALEKVTGLPLTKNPDLALDPKLAPQLAITYWFTKVRSKVKNFNDVRSVTKTINPGLQDIKNRRKEYEKYSDQVDEDADDEQGEEGEESHKHSLIPFPKGTVKVGVRDVYDWYKLGTHINDLDDADPKDFGTGPPQTMLSFGSEEEEHRYMRDLKRLGLGLTDLDE